jgi:hypothetical protein
MTQPGRAPLSWEVRLAAAMVGVGALLGVALLVLSVAAFRTDPGFLFAVLPIVFAFLLGAGLYLTTGSLLLAAGLLRRARSARLRTGVVGAVLGLTGLAVMPFLPWAGFAVSGYGGVLLWLMTTPGAERDLGAWTDHRKQPAPWGGRPGKGIWSSAPQQQGPWAPDPTTLPWVSWKDHSGPRAPWWQTWQAGLAQGIPLWEALVLGALLVLFVVSLALVLLPGARPLGLFGVVVTLAGVVPLELRMRERLAGRR